MFALRIAAVVGIMAVGGCVSSTVQRHAAVQSKQVARANGDQLSDLPKAAEIGSDESKRKKERPAERKKEERCSTCNNDPCTCNGNSSIAGQLVLAALAAPFVIPKTLVNDDWDHVTEFPDYPYADGLPGSLLVNTNYPGPKQTWTGTLQTFTVQGVDKIDRYGGRLVLDSDFRLGIDTETNYWTQSLPQGSGQELWTGDANVVYRFAESEHFQWRAGVGMNWLEYQGRAQAGFNFTYGVEWFPARPWTVSSVFDVGSLGSGSLFHNRTTVGVMLGPVEAFAGYDYFEVESARYHGPVAGLGYRF